jgi:hypothetical protein
MSKKIRMQKLKFFPTGETIDGKSVLGREENGHLAQEMKMNKDSRFHRAKERVEALRGFYANLAAYIVVNAFLLLLNVTTSPDSLWFYWPLLGWGIGIVMHAVWVLGFRRLFGPDWEEKKIQEIMDEV